ncbi:MAG: fucose isomerase, partial [Rhodothermales bacterium]|nr:fucose isomerase [Rhodothermales bacterium]
MKTVTYIANGDLRQSANQKAWPTQAVTEEQLVERLSDAGIFAVRGHDVDETKGHGFIDSQRRGLEVFRGIDPETPLIVMLTTWQYSHHILHGLITHRAPILTIANWSGRYPGLVGMLNLNASMTKAGVPYSTLWSERFDDAFFLKGLDEWINSESIRHDESHARPLQPGGEPAAALGARLGRALLSEKAILGIFDEGCMGMYNAIVPDELLNATGLFKERLSQSALFYETGQVDDATAAASLTWLLDRGVVFHFGQDDENDLTEEQVLKQLKMYHAAVRIADDFGCDAIGIQYQQGLKDLLPASDLAEGLLNNVERPPVHSRTGSRELFAGRAVPHFNEVDECAGIDALVTNRIWTEMGFDPATTLHDVRWGDHFG